MTEMLTQWTDEDSAELDMWALSIKRSPLQRDPHLWELFADLRAEAPRSKTVDRYHRHSHCRDCGKPMRGRHQTRENYPNTVEHHGGGICSACSWKRGDRYRKDLPALDMHCTECDRPMRRRNESIQLRPGTVQLGSEGVCRRCRYGHPRKGARPDNCRGCSKAMRSSRQNRSQHPNTVRHFGHGLCENCHKRASGAYTGPRRSKCPDHCRHCGKNLRPAHADKRDHPNTVLHNGRGLCGPCHRKEREAKQCRSDGDQLAA